MKQSSCAILGVMALAAGISAFDAEGARAEAIPLFDARVIAVNIPGASAVSQVGTFLHNPASCSSPIPTSFPSFIQPGAVLDPNRILVGSRSNFGAPRAEGVGQEGAFLSIDPSGSAALTIPGDFASSDGQASALGGRVQMFSANSPFFLNSVNNPDANTARFTAVSNPLGLSNNNAFGRLWPANAPFGDRRIGTSTVLDPTGRPLAGAPAPLLGGVYAGRLTNRNAVTTPQQPQVIRGSLGTAAVGTALLGPSPDGSCKAVFSVVTADGAIVQEHTLKGLDGVAPAGTVEPVQGQKWAAPYQDVEPRLGVLMNPYAPPPGATSQLFISEPFDNTISVVNIGVTGAAPNQVFAAMPGPVKRISSVALDQPVDLAPTQIDTDSITWASNTTLSEGSDIYVANRGNNTIVRMHQDGTVVAIRRVSINRRALDEARVNGIATSPDGTKIYVTFTTDGEEQGGLLELPAFGG
jgi:hypothetical protein